MKLLTVPPRPLTDAVTRLPSEIEPSMPLAVIPDQRRVSVGSVGVSDSSRSVPEVSWTP